MCIKVKKICILLCCALILSGCGKRDGKQDQGATKEVYAAEFPALPEALEDAFEVQMEGSVVCFCRYEEREKGIKIPVYYEWDYEGEPEQIALQEAEEEFLHFAVDSKDNKYILGRKTEGQDTWFIKTYDMNNKLADNTILDAIFLQGGMDGNRIYLFDSDSQGDFYFAVDDGTIWRLKEGSLEKIGTGALNYELRAFFFAGEKIFCGIEDNLNLYFELPVDGGELQEITSGNAVSGWKIVGATEEGLLCVRGSYLYLWNGQEEDEVLYLPDPYININSNNVKWVSEQKENVRYILLQDKMTGDMEIAILSHQEIRQEKTMITLGTQTPSAALRDMVSRFNRQSGEFSVQIIEYNMSEQQGTLQKLYEDILNGKVPDLIDLKPLPTGELAAKGILLDLTELFQDKSVYLRCAWEAGSVDGRIYGLIPSFTVQTAIAQGKIAKRGWSIRDVMDISAKYPEAQLIAAPTEEIFQTMSLYCLRFGIEAFQSMEGKYQFEGETFSVFLKWLKEMAQKPGEEFYSVSQTPTGKLVSVDSDRVDEAWRQDRLLVKDHILLTGPEDILNQRQLNGTQIVWIGYPSANGAGVHMLNPDNMFGIYADSKVKDGAMSFLEFILSESYQTRISKTFPVRIEALNEIIEETQELEAEEVWDILNNTAYPPGSRKTLENSIRAILMEEIPYYCLGGKTLEETVDVIKNRVELLVEENAD